MTHYTLLVSMVSMGACPIILFLFFIYFILLFQCSTRQSPRSPNFTVSSSISQASDSFLLLLFLLSHFYYFILFYLVHTGTFYSHSWLYSPSLLPLTTAFLSLSLLSAVRLYHYNARKKRARKCCVSCTLDYMSSSGFYVSKRTANVSTSHNINEKWHSREPSK